MIPLKDNIPTSRFPIVTVLLIVANIAVFVWQQSFSSSTVSAPFQSAHVDLSQQEENQIEFGAIPYRLSHPGKDCAVGQDPSSPSQAKIACQGQDDYAQVVRSGAELNEPPWYVTVFTSMFMHGGILHIAFNMLFLWIFGTNVEDAMGRLKYLAFYLLAGIAALYSQVALSPGSTVPTLGASGAIAGVLGAYLVLYPRARVLSLIFIIFFVTLVEIPAWVMLGLWFALQFIPAVGQVATPAVAGGGGVAYFAHVGGFIFGLALVKLFVGRRDERAPPAPAY